MFDRDWLALEIYAYPHLMGEAVDYEVEEEEDDAAATETQGVQATTGGKTTKEDSTAAEDKTTQENKTIQGDSAVAEGKIMAKGKTTAESKVTIGEKTTIMGDKSTAEETFKAGISTAGGNLSAACKVAASNDIKKGI